MPSLSPGDLPDLGLNSSLRTAGGFFTATREDFELFYSSVSWRNLMLVKGLLFIEMQVNYAWLDAADYRYVDRSMFVNSPWDSLPA